MKVEPGRAGFVLAGFVAGALLVGLGLTALLLVRGPTAVRMVGVTAVPTGWAGWWTLAGLSAAMGAAVGGFGALVAWLLSRSRPVRRSEPRNQKEGRGL